MLRAFLYHQLTILCSLIHIAVTAQVDSSHQLLEGDNVKGLEIIEHKQQYWTNSLDKSQSVLKEAYNNRYEYLTFGFNKHHFLYGSSIQPYLDSILLNICSYNKDIPCEDIVIIPTRYATPNAVSMGDGTILIHVGLLNRLQNESQLAWILCHEVAHYTLSHLEKSISQYVASTKDRTLKKDVRRSFRKGQYQKAMGILQKTLYDQRRHNRIQELEADSLGMVYFTRTPYQLKQGIECLKLFQHIDEEKHQNPINLKEIFSSKQYPFKERWLQEETIMFNGTTFTEETPYFNQDSLRTHPACTERIDSLSLHFQNQLATTAGQVFLQDSISFHQWVYQSEFELIEGLYQFENTAYALYQCLQLLEVYPKSVYLHTMVGKCLLQIHEGMQTHELENLVPLPKKEFDESFRQLCAFMHQLRPRELAAISYYYMEQKKEQYSHNENFKTILKECLHIYKK
ncbi:MAG: M48 family metalloprotease [Chitinophagales bacterium]|nr:M48 family metalloprotease [Chitinophagales bacterium]